MLQKRMKSGGHGMKKTWLKRAILSMMVCGSAFGIIPGVQAANVRILPVDNAKFLAGAKFDFDVEVSQAKNLKNVNITINNQPADKFFGKDLKATNLDNGVISYRVNNVNFPKAGSYTVQASATDDTGRNVSNARYTVVQEKAQKQAKNVILFVGDGMSLQATYHLQRHDQWEI